jgi:CRISPR system Cascade subunit CasD
MARFLILVLEAPLISFGAEAVDARGVVSDFPGASMITGLLANALGWQRSERGRHDRLQSRLRFTARIDREGERFTDFQTVQLRKEDKGWTTRGAPEGRAGGAETYRSPYIRRRDYDADKRVTVALALDPAEEAPDLDALASALIAPARPLFLGRKPCLPARPILETTLEASNLLDALQQAPAPDAGSTRTLLPIGMRETHDATILVSDLRNWRSGVHGGQREMAVRTERGEAG